MTSDWSDIINVAFPDEFTKDVPILTIIEENNNDIETNRFNNILETAGINSHINDMIIDQNTTFFHKPDNIASGFYTEERKIIPLKDKLLSISNDIALLKADILGTEGNCKVNVALGTNNTEIYSDRENVITLESYNNFVSKTNTDTTENNTPTYDGTYTFNNGVVSTMLNISISNVGDTAMKLYSVFPGNRNIKINHTSAAVVKKDNYCAGTNGGVWFKYQQGSDKNKLQTQNQFITFRIKDAWTGEAYYSERADVGSHNLQDYTQLDVVTESKRKGMVIYPYVSTKYGLCIDSDDPRSYIVINPGEGKLLYLCTEYVVKDSNTNIEKTISFDLRTSLYSDPVNLHI